jgi:hypothetical protein
MLSLAQAARRRGAAGVPLPSVYEQLEQRQIRFYRSQLALVIGPASAGKSLFTSNLVVRMRRPTLALLLDQDRATAASRFVATEINEPFLDIKENLDDYSETLLGPLGHIMSEFRAEDASDIELQVDAYVQRYGEPPEVLLVDNLGNMTSGFQDEWAILKALTLELDKMAQNLEMAVIACHHTTDLITCEPAARDKMLGKISQYPRLILSVGFNSWNNDYKIAAVKNSSGPTDLNATNPVVLTADPARMQVTEKHALHPQVQQARLSPVAQAVTGYRGDVRGFAGIG